MSLAEITWRAHDVALRTAWAGRQVKRYQLPAMPVPLAGERRFSTVLPPGTAARVPPAAKAAVVAAANQLMRGDWEVLGVQRTDLVMPDWFFDPVTGRRSDPDRYTFRINYRSEQEVGNVKQVWEVSRLQHLTLLAMAWYLTGEQAYAHRVAAQLRSWWRENPFLSGVHWACGIEVGLRLISLAWIRRLLEGWPGAPELFERNPLAVQQIRWHQQYLAAFTSRGSSADNHVVAEAAGQFVASCAFPWFARSERWRQEAARLLERELIRNTFPSGIDRELATGYQCFVAELGMLASAEGRASGHPLSGSFDQRVCAMIDSAAALMDQRSRPPRQGDGDEGRGLLLDAPTDNRWLSLLALGEARFGRLAWWPATPAGASSIAIGSLAHRRTYVAGRPSQRPARFPDAGITVLRTDEDGAPEIWCRCDGGPHGYLSIAAHAHADALSVEVRYGGVDILADPGTYCYHGEPEWRSYFRSTLAHNTIEVNGRSQSSDGGPFLWSRQAPARELSVLDAGEIAGWRAEHGGYLILDPPARHRRTVLLDRATRSIGIIDEIDGGSHPIRLAFHLGPDLRAELNGSRAVLYWPEASAPAMAWLDLPHSLRWSLHRGETSPILGWYSGGLGRRVPAFTLLGSGHCVPCVPLITRLEFLDIDGPGAVTDIKSAVSGLVPGAPIRGRRSWREEA